MKPLGLLVFFGKCLGIFCVLLVSRAPDVWAADNNVETDYVTIHRKTGKTIGFDVPSGDVTVSATKSGSSTPCGPTWSFKETSSPALRVDIDSDKMTIRRIEATQVVKALEAKSLAAAKEGQTFVPKLSPGQVLAKAESFRNSISPSPGVDLRQTLVQYNAKEGVWVVAWIRYLGGVPFEGEFGNLYLDDATGMVYRYVNSVTEATCAVQPRIGLNDAQKVAEGHVMGILPDLVDGQPFKAVLQGSSPVQIMYPNGVYVAKEQDSKQSQTPAPNVPRPVFLFKFSLEYLGKERFRPVFPPVELLVDAITGKVVGGL